MVSFRSKPPEQAKNSSKELGEKMASLIIGHGGILDVLRSKVPEQRWRVPAGEDFAAQADFLTRHPVRPGRQGIVFTNLPGNWMPVADAGWTIYWIDRGQIPIGAQALPEYFMDRSITDFVHEFWRIQTIDKRLVGDIILNRTRQTAPMIIVTSNTGGVGKTVSSRRLCERAREKGLRPLLIDGNMRQSSQRSFFDPGQRMPARTIADWRPGMAAQYGANSGRMFNIGYDVSFAPPAGAMVSWDHYRACIEEARKLWDFVVLDLDRISADDLQDSTTAAGGMVVPYVLAGDLCLVIVKAGVQTQGDALNLLSAFPRYGLPRECIGIKDTVPVGMTDYRPLDYSRYGIFLGVEYQTVEAGNLIASGKSNWADSNLDLAREQTLEWVLPDKGFEPAKFEVKKKKGWFHRG